MLYDGDCGFCKHWIRKWGMKTCDHVQYKPYQLALADYPQLTQKQCQEAIQLVMPDGLIFSGAHAVFKALDCGGSYGWLLWSYNHLPLFGQISEWVYRYVARHR